MTATDRTKTATQIQRALAAAIAAIGLAGAPHARADPGPVDLSVINRDTGEVLPIWRHRGHLFVAGQPGARYSLRVTNQTDDRVLVVMSVDGVNIVTGETANYNQRGYVFTAHESYDVTGWRKSNSEVAAFTFAPLSQSYAARTGRPADVGVIGLAVFKEKAPIPQPEPEASTTRWREGDEMHRGAFGGAHALSRAAPAPLAAPPPPADASSVVTAQRSAPAAKAQAYGAFAAEATPRDEKLGTGHGAREWSVVNLVNFDRATPYPQFVRQIEYDTYAHLVANGVIHPYPSPQQHPRPFPASPDGLGYVPDPPDER
jgi:hypothetical protein